MILPPSTLGMLGGGQLGRFFVIAAHEMGYRVVVLDPDPHSPAGRIIPCTCMPGGNLTQVTDSHPL